MEGAFLECVSGLEVGPAKMGYATYGNRPCRLIKAAESGNRFLLTPITRDGLAIPWELQAEFAGKITRRDIASYLQLQPQFELRSEILKWQGDKTVSEKVKRDFLSEWFTPWELADAVLAGLDPGDAWMRRRKQHFTSATAAWWRGIQGIHEANDPKLYSEMWQETRLATAYLGWPAFFIHSLGRLGKCRQCDKPTPQGRSYCGNQECNRFRASERKKKSRNSPAALRKNQSKS